MRRDEMRRDVHVLAAAVANCDVHVLAACVCLAHAQRAGVLQRGVCSP